MRKELSDFDWHVYGLQTSDFNYTLSLVRDTIKLRGEQLIIEEGNIALFDEEGKRSYDSDALNEVISDLRYYNWLDNLFICQFGLWRLQGIFEGILRQEFFPNEKLPGLKSRLDKVRGLGYAIADSDYNTLIAWGELRNALSHYPPEQYRSSGLNEEDIDEYAAFATKIISELVSQKEIKESKAKDS